MTSSESRLHEDGTLGRQTRDVINKLNAEQRRIANDAVVEQRRQFYEDLISKHPKLKKYEKGWLDRAESFRISVPTM